MGIGLGWVVGKGLSIVVTPNGKKGPPRPPSDGSGCLIALAVFAFLGGLLAIMEFLGAHPWIGIIIFCILCIVGLAVFVALCVWLVGWITGTERFSWWGIIGLALVCWFSVIPLVVEPSVKTGDLVCSEVPLGLIGVCCVVGLFIRSRRKKHPSISSTESPGGGSLVAAPPVLQQTASRANASMVFVVTKCPRCYQEVRVAVGDKLMQVPCPSCGQPFSGDTGAPS